MSSRPLEDWEDPEPDEADDAADDEYVCPSCGADVYEDCECCPHCGDYITPRSRSALSGQGLWMKLVILTLLAVFALGILMAF